MTNIETTVKVDSFPVQYDPIDFKFYGVSSSVSGVGYNIAKALTTLGDNPVFFSIIGNDIYKKVILNELAENQISTNHVLPLIEQTVQSCILNDGSRRKIVLDLKDIQEAKYPTDALKDIIGQIDIAVVCNINFSRGLLKPLKCAGKIIATDVHALSDINDNYNNDYVKYADILFLSNEKIIGNEKDIIEQLSKEYSHKIIVVGMGENGLLIYTRESQKIERFPAVKTRKVVNTIGAGDALFSCFMHCYANTKDPYYSIKMAAIFASYKIGENGGAKGFLTGKELMEISAEGNTQESID